jgi:hypothetical protein
MQVSTVDDVTIHPAVERDSPSFRHTLLQLLVDSQNSDGGWGYHPSAQSATEATAWALCALNKPDENSAMQQCAIRGKEWLIRSQLRDGAWPAFASQAEGCWATSLACLALNEVADDSNAVARGVDWLSQSWPRTPNFLQRLRQRLSPSSNITRQNNSLCGWAWTANTSSWVEPTSYALILMRRLPRERLSQLALKRRELAEAMLCDRMCPGGGWNSGNPLVYGVAGEPLVAPTVWALLALHDSEEKSQVRESLRWLEKTLPEIRGSVSIAIAHMCLESYGQPVAALDSQLQLLFEADRFLGNIPVTALVALALDSARKLFPRAQRVVQL